MRVTRGLLLMLGIPAFFILTALSTLADTSPPPASTASGATTLPGDPEKGQPLFAPYCAPCHGASLGRRIGPALNPIEKPPAVPKPRAPADLTRLITNGRTPNR